MVRKLVELTPRNFLGEKILHAALAHDLRQRSGVPENVRNPHVLCFVAKLLFEIPLSVQDLPDERFARDKVAIGLDPHRAYGFPLAAADGFLDAFPNARIIRFHPRVLLRLRAGEYVSGVLSHVAEGGRKRAGAFADRFAKRPEPGGIDVRVANSGNNVHRVAIVAEHHTVEGGGSSLDAGQIVVVEFVDRFVQRVT
jgi:hypothetical protein